MVPINLFSVIECITLLEKIKYSMPLDVKYSIPDPLLSENVVASAMFEEAGRFKKVEPFTLYTVGDEVIVI